MDFELKSKFYKDNFEKFLAEYISNIENAQKNLLECMKYSLFSGGKRIRPVIMLAMYDLCGGKSTEIYNFAAAIEMIHTYSLIHDDLPCMDNDDFRRGKLCNHKVFGESIALLAGDSLLTEAFSAASKCALNPENVLKATAVLAGAAGTSGMVSGQCLDLEFAAKKAGKTCVYNIYTLKTAALISAAAEAGAILAGASDEKINAAKNFGKLIGVCFQLVDDILDGETGNLDSLGENPRSAAAALTFKAQKELGIFGDGKSFLTEFSERLISRLY